MTIKATTQKDFIKTALRVPPDLHAELHRAASEAERGFNAEILFRLRQSFKRRKNALPSIRENGLQTDSTNKQHYVPSMPISPQPTTKENP